MIFVLTNGAYVSVPPPHVPLTWPQWFTLALLFVATLAAWLALALHCQQARDR